MSAWFWFSIVATIVILLIGIVAYAMNKLDPTNLKETDE